MYIRYTRYHPLSLLLQFSPYNLTIIRIPHSNLKRTKIQYYTVLIVVTRTNRQQNHYLLNHSMVQSPSSEAGQEFPGISGNPKVHYRTHKRPPPVSILGQPNPVHIPTSHLMEIRSNIIRPLRLGLPSCLLPYFFPTKTLYTPSPQPYEPHVQPISFFPILSPVKY